MGKPRLKDLKAEAWPRLLQALPSAQALRSRPLTWGHCSGSALGQRSPSLACHTSLFRARGSETISRIEAPLSLIAH